MIKTNQRSSKTDPVLDARDVTVGFHPDGYRIDKTASPMNRYTKWDILQGNRWCNPQPSILCRNKVGLRKINLIGTELIRTIVE